MPADTAQEIVVASPAAAMTPMELLDRALKAGAEADTLERLMALQERWEGNEARKAFDNAMAEAKAEIPPIKKNRRVGYDSKKADAGRTEYSHEDFAQIARVVNPILSKHGLSYRFRTASPPDGPISVTCIISHRMGYSEENTLDAPRDRSGSKNDIQAIGSTVTYLQRYTLKAALGLAAEHDDDGQTAGGSVDGAEPISQEQLEEIRAKLETSGSDVARFCKYMNVEALPDIRKNDYPKALAAIAQALKAKKAKKTEGAQ